MQNNKIVIKDKKFKLLIEQKEIEIAVKKIAERINQDYKGKKPIFLIVLKGAILFAADLIRYIDVHCEIEFISAKSYGPNLISSGEVQLGAIANKLNDRDVIIVEDIVDTGWTLKTLYGKILEQNPKSITTCAILSKPDTRQINVELKYAGIEIPPYFVIGYGLDYDEEGRNLSNIYIIDYED